MLGDVYKRQTKTIDALYAFSQCEVSISPLSCIISNNKPEFIGVSDILKTSTENTRELLKEELEIELDELNNQWHNISLEKIFIEKNQSLILIIPGFIILAFATKGLSMYLAKVIMIGVAHDVQKNIQSDLVNSLVKADTKLIDKKHSGRFISNLTFDVSLITNLVSVGLLNLTKDTLTLIGLLGVMFYQNWKLSIVALIMIPVSYTHLTLPTNREV